jgi:hypothetical protein
LTARVRLTDPQQDGQMRDDAEHQQRDQPEIVRGGLCTGVDRDGQTRDVATSNNSIVAPPDGLGGFGSKEVDALAWYASPT